MRPIRVTAENYRSFEHLDYTYPHGVSAVTGANGAGKTSLVQLVDTILFADGGRELGPLIRQDADEMRLELEFEHAGEEYRVRRTMRPGKPARIDLDQREPDTDPDDYGWTPLTRETTSATEEAIVTLLGFDRDAFRSSAMACQGEGDRFTTAGAANRKRVLASILGLDLWDDLRDHARRDLADQQTHLSRLDGAQQAHRDIAATRPEAEQHLAAAAASLATAEEDLASGVRAHEQAVAADRQLAEARARLAEARTTQAQANAALTALATVRDRATAARLDLQEAQQDIDQHAPTADTLTGLEAEWEQAVEQQRARQQAIAERDRATAAVDAREQALEHKRAETARLRRTATEADAHADRILAEPAGHACDRCGQPLGENAADAAVASLRADALQARLAADEQDEVVRGEERAIVGDRDAIAAMVIPAAPDTGDLRERIETARAAARELAAARARHTHAQTIAAEWTPDHDRQLQDARAAAEHAHQAVTTAQAALPADADETHNAVRVTDLTVKARQAVRDQARDTHLRAQARLDQIAAAEQHLAAGEQQRTEIQERIDLLTLADRCYGPNGVPALILENTAIPQIETDANDYLDRLGTPYQVELRTQRDLASRDGKKETLDIIVHTPTGERDYTTFSGGERTRVDVALRIALARLLAHRQGANSELLVIDEPDGLDVEGMERLAGILRGLLGDFTTILVVSHNPALGAAFEQVILVDRDGDVSVVREAVAA